MNRNIGLLTLSMALVLTLAGCSGSNAPAVTPAPYAPVVTPQDSPAVTDGKNAAGNAMHDAGDVARGAVDGVGDVVNGVGNAARDVGNGIKNAVR